MSKKCIDEGIGRRLSILDYSFGKSPTEQQVIYKQHLEDCSSCSRQALKASSKRRAKGLLNIFGGLGLIILGLFIPFPGAWLLCLLGGIVWIGIGLWRLISGRD